MVSILNAAQHLSCVQPKNTIMQKILLTIITVCTLTISYGQKTEFRASLNSGLFSFSCKSAETISFINYSDKTQTGYTNNPYGSKSELCIGLSGNIKRVSKKNFILGIDLGYEVLRSKIQINEISGYTGSLTYNYNATGQTFLNYNFINLHPFLGYRLSTNKINFDITGGLELGYCLNTKEDGKATALNGIKYETSVDRKTIKSDIRPRIQLATDYKKIGIYIGYSFGLANYKSGYIGGTNECYARLLRFGLTYQIK